MNWSTNDEPTKTMDATIKTAYALFKIKKLKYVETGFISPQSFDKLNVHNHRARLGATLEEIFPKNDRPRGKEDIDSVNYFLNGGLAEPVSILFYQNQFYKLDGVHRVIASYLLNSNIKYSLYVAE